MSVKGTEKWMTPRQGEMIGGGWVIFRRGKTTGRIGNPRKNQSGSRPPFEYPTKQAALIEAERLSDANPTIEYCVFEQVHRVLKNTKVEGKCNEKIDA